MNQEEYDIHIRQLDDDELSRIYATEHLFLWQSGLIREEISRRQLRQLGKQIDRLTTATGRVDGQRTRLGDSSARLEKLTEAVIDTSRASNKQIKALNESSTKMESLTIALRNLTIWLIVLGALTLLLPVGIEVWKAKREIDAPIAPIVIQHLLPSEPQSR